MTIIIMTIMTIIIMTMMIIITTMAVIVTVMTGKHNGDNINIDVNNFNRITGEHLTDKNMAWRHNPNYRDGMPYHDQDMAKRFHQTDVKRRNERHAATCSNTRQPASGGSKPVSATNTRRPRHYREIPNVRQRHSGLMKLNTMGAMTTSATSAVASH